MVYAVKEIFYTLQGEGFHSGRPAVFCRFAGCNLWSGREEDRVDALCSFCDTDFVGTDGTYGNKYPTANALADRIASLWPSADHQNRFVVMTGGEPLLQLDHALIEALHHHGFQIAIETNGTLDVPPGIDWVCVSPKARAPLRLTKGDELKLIVPQKDMDPHLLEVLNFTHFFVQPMDGATKKESLELAIAFCLRNPRWKLSLQTHKYIGVR